MIFKLITNELNKILGENFELYLNENLSPNFGIPSVTSPATVLGSVMVENGTFRPLTKAQGFETRMMLYLFVPCTLDDMDAVDAAVDRLINTKNGTIKAETLTEVEAGEDGTTTETTVELFDYSTVFDVPIRYSQIERIDGVEYYPMAVGFVINVTQSLMFSDAERLYVSAEPFPTGDNVDWTQFEIPGALQWSVNAGQGMEGVISINSETGQALPTGATTKISVDGLIEKSAVHKSIIETFRSNPQKRYYVRRVLDFGKTVGESVTDYLCVLESCLTNATKTQFLTFSLQFSEVPQWFGGVING